MSCTASSRSPVGTGQRRYASTALGERPFLRHHGHLAVDQTESVDVPETQAADLAQFEQLLDGVVLGADLVRLAAQGQFEHGAGVERLAAR